MPLASTGVEGLDDILNGGLPRGRLFLLQGDPGVGKTTIGLRFLLAGAKAGERCLYITLSETEEELRSVAESHGWSLDGINVFENTLVDHAPTGEDEYTLFNPAEVELGQVMDTLLAEVARLKPARVVFDSLSEVRLLAQNALRYRRQILSLKKHFAGSGCTVLLLDDRTADEGDNQLLSLAHGVIDLEQRAPMFGGAKRRLRVVKLRGARFRGGYHDWAIETGQVNVYPRLVASEHRGGHEKEDVSSGVPALDALLGGGVPRGSSTLVIGPPGTGKSSIATQFMVAAANRGEKGAMFVFDESIETVTKRSDGLGLSIRKHVESGTIHLRQIDPAEMSPGELVAAIVEQVEAGARVVVIDSLNGFIHAMPDENFLIVQMHELLTYLGQKGVITFLVSAQHGLIGTHMVAPVDVSYLADSVVMLRYFEAGGHVRNAISVVKKRMGRHERTIREMEITPNGIHVGAPLEQFRGVLTGTPVYEGPPRQLAEKP